MLYKNNEITSKDKNLMDIFRQTYADHLDKDGSKIIHPIVIKYIPGLVTEFRDPNDKKVKQMMRQSMGLKLSATTLVGTEMVDYRYSPTAITKDKDGNMNWRFNEIDVIRGRLVTEDIDLVYFFEFHSKQNAMNPDNLGSEFAELMIENVASEAQKERDRRKDEIAIGVRLWNDENEGGCSDEKLYAFAESVGMKSVRRQDANSMRKAIEAWFKTDSLGKKKFLNFTEVKTTRKERTDIVDIEAFGKEHDVITRIDPKQAYFWKNEDGTTGAELFSWKGLDTSEKKPRTLFVEYMSQNPELLAEIKAKAEAKKLQAA